MKADLSNSSVKCDLTGKFPMIRDCFFVEMEEKEMPMEHLWHLQESRHVLVNEIL